MGELPIVTLYGAYPFGLWTCCGLGSSSPAEKNSVFSGVGTGDWRVASSEVMWISVVL